MSSSIQSARNRQPAGPAKRAFDWIEVLAIPIASSIMEAQPIILIMLFLGPLMMGSSPASSTSINEFEYTLMLLSLQWWAMLVQHFVQRGMSDERARVLQVVGLLVALVLFVGLNLFFYQGNPLFSVVIISALVAWCWKRGIDRTRTDLNEEQIINAFRIGFIIVIVLVIFAVIFPAGSSFGISPDILSQTLPLFFLSGLLALSFTRLSLVRKENARHPTGSRKDPTRTWALALAGIWIAVVIAALSLQAFSFNIIQRILLPIWNFLGTIVLLLIEGILFVIGSILNFFFKPGKLDKIKLPDQNTTPKGPQNPLLPKASPPSPELLAAGRILLIVVVAIALIIFIRLMLSRVKKRVDDDAEEEERESLDIAEILNERREERQKRRQVKAVFELEALDPLSARARYRELLTALEQDGSELSRRAAETPLEHQRRLALALRVAPPTSAQPTPDAPADPTILDELTQAYARERYGQKALEQPKQGYLSTWVPYLIQRLYRPKKAPVQKQAEDRWNPI